MKIVLTNDDGIDAPGLQTLLTCIREAGQIVIVAPEQPQSGISHKVTTRAPIRPHEYDYRKNENDYTYEGSIHERPRNPGSDVAVCFDEGNIAITRIAVGN